MNTRGSQLVSIAASLAVGFIAGVLFAPASGRKVRQQLGEQARRNLNLAEEKLAIVERQLAEVNERLGETTTEWTGKLRAVAKETVDQHVPDLSMTDEKWDLDESDIKRGLRHMSR